MRKLYYLTKDFPCAFGTLARVALCSEIFTNKKLAEIELKKQQTASPRVLITMGWEWKTEEGREECEILKRKACTLKIVDML